MFFTLLSRRHFLWDLTSDQSEVCSGFSSWFVFTCRETWALVRTDRRRRREETHRKLKTKTHFIHLIWNNWELKFVFVLWSDETESCSHLISDQLETSSDSPTENRISGGRNTTVSLFLNSDVTNVDDSSCTRGRISIILYLCYDGCRRRRSSQITVTQLYTSSQWRGEAGSCFMEEILSQLYFSSTAERTTTEQVIYGVSW